VASCSSPAISATSYATTRPIANCSDCVRSAAPDTVDIHGYYTEDLQKRLDRNAHEREYGWAQYFLGGSIISAGKVATPTSWVGVRDEKLGLELSLQLGQERISPCGI